LLKQYYELSELALGPRVFVAAEGRVVTSYIAVSDLIVGPTASDRWFFYTALATGHAAAAAPAVLLLVRRAELLYAELLRIGKRYVGEIAAPGDNAQLADMLSGIGFQPHNALMWVRTRGRRPPATTGAVFN
jgi:hypothetical protein